MALFQISFHDDGTTPHTLLGAVTCWGKAYFCAREVGLILGENAPDWGYRFGCCRLGDLFPDARFDFAGEWVVERTSLVRLLEFRRFHYPEVRPATENLLSLLNADSVQFAGEESDVTLLRRCPPDLGSRLSAWLLVFLYQAAYAPRYPKRPTLPHDSIDPGLLNLFAYPAQTTLPPDTIDPGLLNSDAYPAQTTLPPDTIDPGLLNFIAYPAQTPAFAEGTIPATCTEQTLDPTLVAAQST